jgi:uncharacterized C2H2 Zn-finger protein
MSIAQAQDWATRLRAVRPELSPEERQARDGQPRPSCPHCGRVYRLRRPRYRRPDGRPVEWVNAIGGHHVPAVVLRQAGATLAECPRCGGQWQVFASVSESLTGAPELVERGSSWEPGLAEVRRIDNSRSGADLKRTMTIAHEWRQAVQLETENAREDNRAGNISLSLAEVSASVERTVKSHYQVTQETARTQTDEITVTVPAHTITTITLTPEFEWRHGIVRIPRDDRQIMEIPYRVRVGVKFDVAQVDG